MAGLKITDLEPLGEATSDDLLYIVDVTDTTMSPEGTSKKITFADLHPSGSYTPVLSNPLGAISNPALQYALYSRCGNVVNVTICGLIDIDFSSNTVGTLVFTLPIPTTSSEVFGNVSINAPNPCSGVIIAGAGISLKSNDTGFVQSELKFVASFQYLVS